jgi:hypothetical protein
LQGSTLSFSLSPNPKNKKNMQAVTKLSNMQLELLKLFATNISDSDVLDIKQLIINYYAQKIDNELDTLWEQRQYNANTISTWANEHLRTPYNQ